MIYYVDSNGMNWYTIESIDEDREDEGAVYLECALNRDRKHYNFWVAVSPEAQKRAMDDGDLVSADEYTNTDSYKLSTDYDVCADWCEMHDIEPCEKQ